MNVSLTPELERFVFQKTESGMYTSASEVIREALRIFIALDSQKRARVKQLNDELDIGLAQLSRHETVPSAQAFTAIRKKSAARKAKSVR